MAKILLAYDGSDQSKRALRYAPRLGAGDTVSLIEVLPTLIEAPHTREYVDPNIDTQEHRDELAEAQSAIAESGADVERIVVRGNPAEEILNAAEERGVELIILGRHGVHGVERFLLGSVSDRVVRHAACDVLVVK